jgi:hypothetical protein
MKKNEYTIKKRVIPNVNLHSLTGQYWYDNQNNLIPWSDDPGFLPTGYTPYSGYVVNNVTGSLPTGSYIWNGSSWTGLTGSLNLSYTLPIYLNADADEMGVMSSFDGNVEQVEQLINFTYKQSGSVVTVYNTVNPNKLRKIVDQTYTINWGDGYTSGLTVNSGVLYSNFPNSIHTYPTVTGNNTGSYTLTLSLDSPWNKEKITKNITISTGVTVSNVLGTSTGFTLPGNIYYTGSQYQNYLNDLDYTNNTGNTIFRYAAIGGSKIAELKKYGETTVSSSLYTTGTYSGSLFTGYTLSSEENKLFYMDFSDGYTMITGTTSAFTKEEVYNKVITRNEHFLGFIDDPTVYSDIFVERGRQGVMEVNLRLGEIDNMNELDIYGNGFFKVKKQ